MKTELISALSGILIGFGDPMIKYAMNLSGLSDFNLFDVSKIAALLLNWMAFLGILLALIGSIIYVVALSRGKASIVNPLSGGASYITLVILSSMLVGETISIQKVVGILVIIFGIYLVSIYYAAEEKKQELDKIKEIGDGKNANH